MFTGFFYTLREEGIPVTPTEWMTLMDALNQGLAGASLSGFYHLARTVLVKSETQYDRYDQAFSRYFSGIETPEKLAEQVSRWLEKSLPPLKIDPSQKVFQDWNLEDLKKALEERIARQKEEHHGGSQWIGTGGTSRFGHSGYNPAGVRIGGVSVNRSAVKVAGERRYRDFRADDTINTRHFEVALKKLRQLRTVGEKSMEDLDLEGTIEATCKRAGMLELVWERPRKNTVKVVLMMDTGGSMNPFSRLCGQLFSAASKVNHFKDIKFFYFHNCIYERLFLDPYCSVRNSVKTDDIMGELSSDYKLILVGDASMAPSELLMIGGALDWGVENNEPGLTWLERLSRHFHHNVWLNPIPKNEWPPVESTYDTIAYIRRVFPMFELTVEGLESAVAKLKVNK